MAAVMGLVLAAAAAPWTRTSPAQMPPAPLGIHHIHGLALDRRDPEVLYIATHTGLVRLRPNAGPEWVGALFDLMGFTAHPREPEVVYASGHPDVPTYRVEGVGNLGLLLSRDGDRSWRSVALRGEADFHALTYSPQDGGALYGWSVAGRPGLYRIGVAGWTVQPLAAAGLADVLSLAASPDPSGSLLAGTKDGMRASLDRGATWRRVTGIPSAAVPAVAYHAGDGRLVYASVTRPGRGLLRSRDAGATWESTGSRIPPESVVVALTVGPGEHVAAATSTADVFRSRDGGRSWTAVVARGQPVPGRP